MLAHEIGLQRLAQQQISQHQFARPEELVGWMGAMQAQDQPSAKWAVGVRLPGITESAVEQAIRERKLVVTWALRGTLHLIAAADVRWLVALIGTTMLHRKAGHYRQLELDEQTFQPILAALTNIMQGGEQWTRQAIFAALEAQGIATQGARGVNILYGAAHAGVICRGVGQGRQDTYVLLDEWLPPGTTLSHEEALAELARRYFTSHGPATLQDFAWWSSLLMWEARQGLEAIKTQLQQARLNGQTYYFAPSDVLASQSVYLLPGFDEYLLGYKDRSMVVTDAGMQKIVPGNNGIFSPMIVMDGQIVGVWKRTIQKSAVSMTLHPFTTFTAAQIDACLVAAQPYGDFLGLPVVLAS